MMSISVLVIALCLVSSTYQRSTPQDDSYVAAVVEYQVQSDGNLQNYERLIQEAAEQDADIVVFPELTLTRGGISMPLPTDVLRDNPIPALASDLYDELTVGISTAARRHQIYVVVNGQEMMDCENWQHEDCPEKKQYFFNTNVVFNREGAIIDKYRKINLFGEFSRTPALHPDMGIFTTDFGVTFGHFICFDLMFQVPAVQVVEKYNITDVIFPTMWFSELPYLTAVQIQQAYAHSLNVNFLGSGANNVRVGSAGSGIYSGKAGALVSTMPGLPTTRLLVARVPKVPGQVTGTYPGPIYDNPADHDSLVLISDPSLPSHISRPLAHGFQEFTLVDKDVTCKFTVRLNLTEGEGTPQFRAFIFDGSNTYARRSVGVAFCLVTACKDDHVTSCAHRYKDIGNNPEIEELQIEMITYGTRYNSSLHCDDIVYFPSTLTNTKFPLSPKNFTYVDEALNSIRKQNGGRERINMKLLKPQDNLITFGIWGRLYSRDVNHIKKITAEDVQQYREIENIIFGSNKQ